MNGWRIVLLGGTFVLLACRRDRSGERGSSEAKLVPIVASSSAVVPASAPMPPATATVMVGATRDSADGPSGMLHVPGGEFTMGQDDRGELDERPAHRVRLEGFWLDRTEVTNAAYDACVAAGTCRPRETTNAELNRFDDRDFRGPRQPVTGVSWDDAVAYCRFVGKRLPREAEWERAARGDDARRYPWGDEPPTVEHAVFQATATGDAGAHPRGAGPYGHLDLAGNVWEWVADAYDPMAYRRATAGKGEPAACGEILRTLDELRANGQQGFTGSNPIPTECERVLRGGAFNYPADGIRASNRVHHPARFRLIMAGFRCAKDAPPG